MIYEEIYEHNFKHNPSRNIWKYVSDHMRRYMNTTSEQLAINQSNYLAIIISFTGVYITGDKEIIWIRYPMIEYMNTTFVYIHLGSYKEIYEGSHEGVYEHNFQNNRVIQPDRSQQSNNLVR